MAVQLFTLPAVTLADANVPVAVTANRLAVTTLVIQAEPTNVGSIYIGQADVTTSSGLKVDAGDTIEMEGPASRAGIDELLADRVYVVTSTGGNSFRVSGFKRAD